MLFEVSLGFEFNFILDRHPKNQIFCYINMCLGEENSHLTSESKCGEFVKPTESPQDYGKKY